MAQLSPSSILLDRRADWQRGFRQRGTTPGAVDDQRPDTEAGRPPRREDAAPLGPSPRSNRDGPGGASIRRRDLLGRPGIARHGPRGRTTGRPMQLVVGVVDVLPKFIAHWLIEPALRLGERVRLVWREATPEQLLAQLSVQSLHVVLADAPIAPSVKVRAYNHLLGETGVSFLGNARLAEAYHRRFSKSLLSRAGEGIFPVPTVLEERWTIRSRRVLAGVSTGGPTATSTWAPSSRWPPTSSPSPISSASATPPCGRSSPRGVRGSSMPGC